MLLLAHLLTHNWEWGNTAIRVLRLVPKEEGRVPALADLQGLIDASRVDAAAVAIVDERPFPQVLRAHSGDATTVFLGFEVPAEGGEEAWYESFQGLVHGMPTTILVHSVGAEDLLA